MSSPGLQVGNQPLWGTPRLRRGVQHLLDLQPRARFTGGRISPADTTLESDFILLELLASPSAERSVESATRALI